MIIGYSRPLVAAAGAFYLDPNGDIFVRWDWSPALPVTHFDKVADLVRQPNTPDITNYVGFTDATGLRDEYSLTAPTGAATTATIWAYGYTPADRRVDADFSGDGVTWPGYVVLIPAGSPEAWYSVAISGSWTQAELEDAAVRIIASDSGTAGSARVDALYVYCT